MVELEQIISWYLCLLEVLLQYLQITADGYHERSQFETQASGRTLGTPACRVVNRTANHHTAMYVHQVHYKDVTHMGKAAEACS
jgi:hypothetical protein